MVQLCIGLILRGIIKTRNKRKNIIIIRKIRKKEVPERVVFSDIFEFPKHDLPSEDGNADGSCKKIDHKLHPSPLCKLLSEWDNIPYPSPSWLGLM